MTTVRDATPDDAVVLAQLRVVMLEGVGRPPAHVDWLPSAAAELRAQLAAGSMLGAVAEADGRIASGGMARLWRMPPGVDDDGSRAYVFGVATRPEFRRRGLGRAVVTHLVDVLDARGISRIELTASPGGIDLYRSLGFEAAHDPLLRRYRRT
jgi:ribosomal protein S18 acetylase RimI-like enzyme